MRETINVRSEPVGVLGRFRFYRRFAEYMEAFEKQEPVEYGGRSFYVTSINMNPGPSILYTLMEV